MNKTVVGIFATSYEAIKAIDSLEQDGIDAEHIYVVVNGDLSSDTIEEKTGVTVNNGRQHSNQFWEELKSFMTKTDSETIKDSDFLFKLGLTETDAKRYADELENGHILVLVDSGINRGRRDNLSTENIHFNENGKVHGEKVDNFTAGDRFDREEHPPQAAYFGEKQAGRPKERTDNVELLARQREYEEEVNPFEHRYPESYSSSQLQPQQ